MANRKQRRATAEHHHVRAQIDKRLFRASRVARIMHINMLHERRGALPNTYIASV
ncbi:TPA: derepression protein, partial [Escherichia coli]